MSASNAARTDGKHVAQEIIDKLPTGASLEDIIHELYFHHQVVTGLNELDRGPVIPNEEVEADLQRWIRGDAVR